MVKQQCPEIICITVSWLTCNIPDIAVNLDGYHLIRKDRSSGPGGGVDVYITFLAILAVVSCLLKMLMTLKYCGL